MPFEKISLLEQDSQQAIIANVCGDVLVCKMTGMNEKGDIRIRMEYVSRAPGLREVDLDPDIWEMSALNTRSGVAGTEEEPGSKSGVIEHLSPPYITGEEIFITKKLKDPVQIDRVNNYDKLYAIEEEPESGPGDRIGPVTKYEGVVREVHCFRTGLAGHFGKNENTAAFMVDENRAGRSWGVTGGSSAGMPEGYESKCVAFCEGGETTSGTILFKLDGCEPVSSTGPEGTGPGGTHPGGTHEGGTGPGGTHPGGTHPGGTGPAVIGLPPDAPSAGTIDFIPL